MGEKMSVTRALAELKLLDARINKAIEYNQYVDLYQKRINRVLISKVTREEFDATVKSQMKSVEDLIERRKKMKAEILKSNSKTEVKISGTKYFIVEAIERKNSIQYEKRLLEKMKSSFAAVDQKINEQRVRLDDQVEKMLEQNLGVDKKAGKDDYDNIAKPFYEANEFNMADPVNIKKRIESLEKTIDEFMSEVDFVLSESNSRTEIEI